MKTKLRLRLTDLKKKITGNAEITEDGDWIVHYDNGEVVTILEEERNEPLDSSNFPLQRRYAAHH